MNWIRANADRVALSTAGVMIFVVAMAIREREVVASPLAILGVAVFVLGVILPRVRSFSVGTRGIEARLEQIQHEVRRVEGKVDMIVRPATIEAKATVFPPDVIVDPPARGDDKPDSADP
jgi:hypothetical protein